MFFVASILLLHIYNTRTAQGPRVDKPTAFFFCTLIDHSGDWIVWYWRKGQRPRSTQRVGRWTTGQCLCLSRMDSTGSTLYKGTKLHFKSPTAERRHVLCVGVGGDRTHASRPGGAGHARLVYLSVKLTLIHNMASAVLKLSCRIG
jgi:hypothetical protein